MTDDDVVYSDVKFIKSTGKATGEAFPPAETTYAGVRKTEPSTELPGSQQQAVPNGGSKITSERVAIAVLSALLAAAAIALGFTSHKNSQTMEELQKLTAVNKNLTGRHCEVKTCNLSTTCPQPPDSKIPVTCLKCQEGWEKHGGHCYYFSTNRLLWNRSREECRRKGGDLVQIDSKEEQSFLAMKLQDKMNFPEDKFWIGLTDSQEEGAWLWVDGSPLNISLAFWSDREPDDWKGEDKDGEDCARMGEKGSSDLNSWLDKSCKMSQKSICEKSAETGRIQCI
ncbi:C-type lectin domain family 4 member C-like isoform X2 [Chelmon rostratus]|uniref:C-type lectin domain family 4 member C-like isoform X2 n=1 Tax=Chelmon rostratus TaxID=109905 RepID=UPI001BEA273A|nr:C-type lectin domain family 4 member C-like isoform X2 [Chelmon rostratus]